MSRAQAHTLEAIVAALLVLSAIVFALEMTAVTPLTASTSSQHIENQQQAAANGVLATAAETGALRQAVLFWNDSARGGKFHDAPPVGHYTTDAPPNRFGVMLQETFGREGIAFNVYITYIDNGQWFRQSMVYRGTPSDNAVSASQTLSLTDGARLHDENGRPTSDTVVNSTFYAEDEYPGDSVFNTLRVEVVVWRI